MDIFNSGGIVCLWPPVLMCIVHAFFLVKLMFALWLTQVVEWGADGVIVGSAIVKILGDASSPEDGLAALKKFTQDLKNSIP